MRHGSDAAQVEGLEASLQELCAEAVRRYRTQCLDNIQINPGPVERGQALVIARALMRRGDWDAFILGRRIKEAVECL